jgi:DNA-binding NarL/FixJ family response regulator
MTVRVVVAEDSLLVREGIERLLDAADDIEVVALAEDLDGLLEAVEASSPDLLLTDICMPPTGTDEGIRAATTLRQTHPELGVLVLSHYVEPGWALSLLAGGSAGRGYLLKDHVANPTQLVRAIRDVAAGGSVVDPLVIEALVTAKSRGQSSPLADLTPRELEVLAEIAQGKNNAAIAESLFLSQRAVEKHINALFAKLGLTGDDVIHRRVTAVLLYLANRSPGSL